MSRISVTITERGTKRQWTSTHNTTDNDDAISRAIAKHFGTSKYLIENRELTNGGSRVFGQIAHALRGNPGVNTTDTGVVYIDTDIVA